MVGRSSVKWKFSNMHLDGMGFRMNGSDYHYVLHTLEFLGIYYRKPVINAMGIRIRPMIDFPICRNVEYSPGGWLGSVALFPIQIVLEAFGCNLQVKIV